ncbi:MAG: nucleotidyltransferase domain-containing protein [archaeon]
MIKKSIKNKIKEYFFVNPTTKLRVRQIERETKTPLPSVIRYTKELEKEEILKSQKISNVKFYSADRSSKEYLIEKKLFNIKQIMTTKLIKQIVKEYDNANIVLFGSYSKGEDVENSDIDIYVESSNKNKINLNKYETELKRNIQIFKYQNLKEIKNKDFVNSIINGIVLNGFIEVYA